MPTNLLTRAVAIEPKTYDAESRSALARLATEAPIYSTDSATGRPVLEVWRMDGMEPADQVPLLNTHDREGVECVLGSVSEIKIKGSELWGRVSISATEPDTATKVSEGHIRDVSAGIQPLEVSIIRAGQSATIDGQEYTAPEESDLRIVTRWRLREVSLCPIGADPAAKIRSFSNTGGKEMNAKMRAYLERIGMPKDAADEDAQAFYESLPELARKRADQYVMEVEDEDSETEGEAESEDMARADDVKKIEGEDLANTAKSASEKTSTRSSRRNSAQVERQRVIDIQDLGEGVPAATVRKAIEEGWSKERAAMEFLRSTRSERGQPIAPATSQRGVAIHSRSREQEMTADVLGTALALRTISGDKMFKASKQYGSDDGSEFTLRRNSASEDQRAQLMERAERYGHMSIHDMVRAACEIDGHKYSYGRSIPDMLRTATSGSALAAIFTTNFNAQFMSGYIDYADSTTPWCHSEDVVNFLTREVATMGKFQPLQKVTRGQIALDLNTSDWKESYKVARYGGKFVIDEQDIINDRFGALEQQSPMDMGLAAAQLRPQLVYSEMLNNDALDVDGVDLFHADHGNYASGGSSALDATTLQAAISAIAKQRIAGRVLNLQPRYLIVPQDLRWTAEILLKSQQRIISANSGGTYNPLENLLEPICDDRIGVAGVIDPRTGDAVAGSATNWFLVCRPGDQGAKTVMVGYLAGSGRAPRVRSFVLDRGQWGLGWDVSFDIGVKALDYRAMYKATGA